MEENKINNSSDNSSQNTIDEIIPPKDPIKERNKLIIKEITELISDNPENQSEEKTLNELLTYVQNNNIDLLKVFVNSTYTLAHKYCSEKKYFHLKIILLCIEKLSGNQEKLNNYLLNEDITHMNIFECSSELGDINIFRILSKYLINNPDLVNSLVSQEKNNIFHIAATENKVLSLLFFYEFYKNNPSILNKQNKSSWTPLHTSCYRGHYEFTQSLVNLGADINFLDKENKNALFFAVESGNIRIIKYLILSGINKNQIDKSNKKAIQYSNNKEINDVLSDKTLIDIMVKCAINFQSLKGHRKHIYLLVLVSISILIQIIILLRKESIIKCYEKLNFNPEFILLILDVIFEIICLIIYIFISIDSNKKKTIAKIIQPSEEKIYELYNNNPDLCIKCKKIMMKNTQHCIACDRCIDNWDHHCFWLNTCIDNTNKMYFNIFLIELLLILLTNLFTCLLFLFDLFKYPSIFSQILSNTCMENKFGISSFIFLLLVLFVLILILFFIFSNLLPYFVDLFNERKRNKKVDAFTEISNDKDGNKVSLLYIENIDS